MLALELPPGTLQPAKHRRQRRVRRGGLRHEERFRVELRVADRAALTIAAAGPSRGRVCHSVLISI
jgi:hypothetical protein